MRRYAQAWLLVSLLGVPTLAADTKLSALSSIDGATVTSATDLLYIVDASAGTSGSKKITVNELMKAIGAGARQVDEMRYVPASGSDDITALQAALTAAGDGTTIVLHGAYSVSDGLTLAASGVTIWGMGASITQTGTPKKTLTITGDRVRVSGVHFVGKGTEDPWSSVDWNGVCGVYINAADSVEISDCRFTNHAGGDIDLTGACSDVKILHNTCIGMGGELIEYNDNGADAAVGSAGNTAAKNGLIIANNDLSHHAHGVFATTGAGICITGNVIHDCHGQHGIYVQQGGDLVISNNVICDIAENGIKLQHQTAEDVEATETVVGNTVTRCGDIGIAIMPAGAGVGHYTKNAAILSNNVYDTEYGIYVRGAYGVHVAGNRIRKASYLGFYIYDVEGSFIGNRVSDSEGAAVLIYKPQDRITMDGLVIVDSPLNVGASSSVQYRTPIYITDEVSPDNGYVYLSNVEMRYEDATPPANLQYAINTDANSQVVFAGPMLNQTSVIWNVAGTLTATREFANSAAPTNGANKAYLYAADVSAGRSSIHAMTEEGHIVKLFRGAAIADVPTGGSANAADNATAINAILARLRVTGGNGMLAD